MSIERQSINRTSYIYQLTSYEQASKVLYELSYLKVGDQQNHLNFTHDKLVLESKWLSESSFKELKQLCWFLPGPTTLQIILTLVILKTKSLNIGIKCFLIYSLIPWILYGLITLLYVLFIKDRPIEQSNNMILLVMGFNSAAAGIMIRSFSTFFVKFLESWPKIILILVTAAAFSIYPSMITLLCCLILCSIVSLYLSVDQTIKPMSLRNHNFFNSIPDNFLLGKTSTLILVFAFVGLWFYFSIYPQSDYSYIFIFYLIGCLIIGPIESIFCYILVGFSSLSHFDQKYVWIALPLIFVLPGTHTNIGIFIGAMVDGFRGALLALISLNLPCFLSIFGLLPQWRNYRDREGVRRLCQGLTCATTGLTLGMIILTLKQCVSVDVSSSLCIFSVAICLNFMSKKYTFAIVILGGFLAYIRYISIVCYRKGTYCPFPFNF